MANQNAPRGLTPVKYRSGMPYSGISRRYYKDATAGILAVGDNVIRVTNSSDPKGGPEVVKATVGAAITGVIVGIEPHPDRLGQVGYLAAADLGYVLVADDPNLLFEVQEGGTGTALAVTNVGEHIDVITAADASTTIGRSVAQLDKGALATGNTYRIEEFVQRENNELGLYAKWLVSANLHTEVNASATNLTEV